MRYFKNLINKYFLQIAKKIRSISIQDKQELQRKYSLFEVGDHTYGVENIIIDRYQGSDNIVKIGKYCSIATEVRIITGGIHPVSWVSTFPFRAKFNLEGKFKDGMPVSNGPVKIENDVWIGTGVTILSGITIGNGAVLAANATITKDVPAYAVVGGNPAKIIKMRFSDSQIKKLEMIQWWDWDIERIQENIPLLNSNSIEEFLKNIY